MLCIPCIHTILNKTMLKMTQSFCRYTRFICQIINYKKTHVKTYSFWSCQGNTCLIENIQNSIGSEYGPRTQQVRLLANIKKRIRIKRPQNSSSVSPTIKQMTNQLQRPSVTCRGNNGNGEDGDNVPQRDAPSTSTGQPINKRRDQIPTNFRQWEYINRKADGNPFRFKVVSYNVLAQYLLECHPYLYTQCDPEDLQWDVRSERIFEEIMNLKPDILCLQEVQRNHVKSFYSKFEDNGYNGIFKQKTGHREDGCAIYYKKDLFHMEDHQTVEFFQPEMPLLNRDNVGLMMKLIPRTCPRVPLIVATTHLLYNPLRTDVRLAQMQVMLAELDRFAYFDLDGMNTGYYPIILTGDFNSTPNSVVIRLLEDGVLSPVPFRRDRYDWRMLAVTDNCQHLAVHLNRSHEPTSDYSMIRLFNSDTSERAFPTVGGPPPRDPDPETVRNSDKFNTKTLTHPLRLSSVYPHYKRDRSPEATTFQDYWVNVDYIYFSCCNKLKLLERYRLPTARECGVLGSLPNDVYGSDHLLLAAHFEIRNNLFSH